MTVIGKPVFPDVGSAADVLSEALNNPVGSTTLDVRFTYVRPSGHTV